MSPIKRKIASNEDIFKMRITNPVIKFGDFKDNLKDILKDNYVHLFQRWKGHKGYTYRGFL